MPLWAGASIGAVAALAASAVMLWLSERWGGTLPAQALSDRALAEAPLDVSRRVLVTLGGESKALAFLSVTLAQIVAGGLAGLIWAPSMRPGARSRLLTSTTSGAAIWLGWSCVAAPLGGLGWFALDAPGGFWRTQATLVVGTVVFALLVAMLPRPVAGATPVRLGSRPRLDRRRFVSAFTLAGFAAPALLSAAYLGGYTRRLRTAPPGASDTAREGHLFGFAGMPPVITPTSEFYVVSKNFVDPTVDTSSWALVIDGLVERPLRLSYSDLLTREAVEFVSTLICISNTVGGPYVSTGVWRGLPLRDLLLEAGADTQAFKLYLQAADGYTESLPLEKALAADTMLVHTLNDEPLTDAHGYPARLIVPGRYGIKNVKWLTQMTVVGEDVRGYWQTRLWSETAIVETTSRIDTPRRGRRVPLGAPVQIGGMAFAGDRGIERVELSLDDGQTWFDVEVMDELSPRAWRLWRYVYTPAAPGIVKVAVRATDGTGAAQSAIDREPLPEGATGYHRAWFEVREPGT